MTLRTLTLLSLCFAAVALSAAARAPAPPPQRAHPQAHVVRASWPVGSWDSEDGCLHLMFYADGTFGERVINGNRAGAYIEGKWGEITENRDCIWAEGRWVEGGKENDYLSEHVYVRRPDDNIARHGGVSYRRSRE